MGLKLKPLAEQVVVVSGADTAVGEAIARLAATAGAAVVLIGRDESVARRICAEINQEGGRAHPLAGDATDAQEASRLARAAVARFGGFDTWISVAANELAAANAAREAAAHYSERGGAVIDLAPGRRNIFGAAQRRALAEKGRVALSQISLPKDFDPEKPIPSAARTALRAAGEVGRNRGVLIGLGVVGALGATAAAAWFGRSALASAAAPMIRRQVTKAVMQRPAAAAKLAARHPRQTLSLAKLALR
ncbi:SDR family NAD(P)-dependent oxidoreductase [Phenylobacterium immobile]|uniref:SDR family NAD(P)-dependent oxidoreductase n=1 Tax=Phenylobacterium immobile TaxID=21 RepID=UPI000A585A71|nr:SDR family NAD(P)-dependent oxidoreductase [Phenylobacterium immobile]